jgi:hypothetical protein
MTTKKLPQIAHSDTANRIANKSTVAVEQWLDANLPATPKKEEEKK